MPCCHADFAAVEGSDRGFTRRHADVHVRRRRARRGRRQRARARPAARRAVHRPRGSRAASTSRRSRRRSRPRASTSSSTTRSSSSRPTRRSRTPRASRAKADFDGYVSVGGGSVMDTCKAANLYASASRRVHDLRQRADRRRAAGAGTGASRTSPARRPSGTGSETTGIAIFKLRSINAKTGIISRRLIPDRRADRSRRHARRCRRSVVAATGFDCMSHALESITARALSAPAQSGARRRAAGVAGRESVLRRARQPGAAERRQVTSCAPCATRRTPKRAPR